MAGHLLFTHRAEELLGCNVYIITETAPSCAWILRTGMPSPAYSVNTSRSGSSTWPHRQVSAYSLINPHAYVSTNLAGFANILEGCRHNGVRHLVFASSSSVYGANTRMPLSIHDNVDHPVSLYAASKKANELMAHTYSHLYRLPVTGLRFFTVYGPWGRPDMSYSLFARNILEGRPIDVFNYGNHRRDFTYIDDVVEGVIRVLDRIPEPNPAWERRCAGPGDEYGALSTVQYRQQPAGRTETLYRSAGGLPGQEGSDESSAVAARRCSGYLCGCD